MHLRIIKKRLRALEAATRFSARCKCRCLGVTFFHSVADLERITAFVVRFTFSVIWGSCHGHR